MRNLVPVGDVVIDTNEIVMLKGDSVLVRDRNNELTWYGVGEKAADAIRRYVTSPAEYWNRLSLSPSTSDKGLAESRTLPGFGSSQEKSSEAEELVQRQTCVITSSPADETAKAKDDTKEKNEARQMEQR